MVLSLQSSAILPLCMLALKILVSWRTPQSPRCLSISIGIPSGAAALTILHYFFSAVFLRLHMWLDATDLRSDSLLPLLNVIIWFLVFVNHVFEITRSNVLANSTTLSPSSFLSPSPILPCEVDSLPFIPTCPFRSPPIITVSACLVAVSNFSYSWSFSNSESPCCGA